MSRSYGTFFIEEHPEDLSRRRERDMQQLLKNEGLYYGKVTYESVEGLVSVWINNRHFGYYDAVENKFIYREEWQHGLQKM